MEEKKIMFLSVEVAELKGELKLANNLADRQRRPTRKIKRKRRKRRRRKQRTRSPKRTRKSKEGWGLKENHTKS